MPSARKKSPLTQRPRARRDSAPRPTTNAVSPHANVVENALWFSRISVHKGSGGFRVDAVVAAERLRAVGPHLGQLLRIRNGEAAQLDGVDEVKDGGVRADAEREREDRDDGEDRTAPQQPQPVSHVADRMVDQARVHEPLLSSCGVTIRSIVASDRTGNRSRIVPGAKPLSSGLPKSSPRSCLRAGKGYDAHVPSMPLSPGTRLGPYEIIAPIGVGGMGEVYKARDTRLDRIVAIRRSRALQRTLRARGARDRRLNHPHICSLYDVGPDYLVMEYIEGKPLGGPCRSR